LLGEVADVFVHFHVGDGAVQDFRGAGGGENNPHEKFNRRGFSGAVGAEEAKRVALFDLHR
jgi:hypothetical protein